MYLHNFLVSKTGHISFSKAIPPNPSSQAVSPTWGPRIQTWAYGRRYSHSNQHSLLHGHYRLVVYHNVKCISSSFKSTYSLSVLCGSSGLDSIPGKQLNMAVSSMWFWLWHHEGHMSKGIVESSAVKENCWGQAVCGSCLLGEEPCHLEPHFLLLVYFQSRKFLMSFLFVSWKPS